MEEAPENGKESSHSAHVNGMNERTQILYKYAATCFNHYMGILRHYKYIKTKSIIYATQWDIPINRFAILILVLK